MLRLLVVIPALSIAASAAAADRKPLPRPALLKELVDCRSVTDAAARLQCYDATVAKVDAAEQAKELVIVDHAEVKKARRGLFGLSLPDLGGLFGGGDDDKEEGVSALGGLEEISSTIKSASLSNYGRWTFTIEDGATWVQTEGRPIRTIKPGQPVRIRKAALGSFFANINDQSAVRVMRLR